MKRLVAILISCLLIVTSLSITVSASGVDDTAGSIFTPKKLANVNLGSGSYAEIVNASLLPRESENLIAISVKFYNGSTTDLQMNDYWLRVRSAVDSNVKYSVKLIPSDLDIARIPAKSSRTLTYYSMVGSNAKLNDIIVDFIKWDFNVASFERVLGSVKIGEDIFTIPANYTGVIDFAGMQLNTTIEKSLISKNEKQYKSTIYFKLYNNGKSALSLPNLQYYILTSEGILYQLQSNAAAELKIDPKMERELILRGNVPISIEEAGWKFVVANPLADNKQLIPIATYSLPKSTQESGDDFSKEYSFTNLDGLYYTSVNTITRSALEDKDIITANITISNKGTEPLPVPSLGAKFTLDGVIHQEATVIQPNKVLAIQPNRSIDVNIYSLIPYTYEFDELKLVLQEQTSENDKEDILEITGKDVFSELKMVGVNDQYEINHVGSASSYQLRATRTYSGLTSKMLSAQIEVTNKERRLSNVLEFTGYFKTSDGNVFPAQIAEVKSKMVPGGKALLDVTTVLPNHYDSEGATLVLGEAIASDTNNEANAAAYVNPVELALGNEIGVQEELDAIYLYPYTLALSKIKSQIIYGQDKIQIDFDYTLDKNALVQFNGENKLVVIEIKDEKNNIAFTNEYKLTDTQTEGASFQLGTHQGTFSAVDSDLIFKIQTMNNDFTFNVYEQSSPGHKKLLASKQIRWFSTTK